LRPEGHITRLSLTQHNVFFLHKFEEMMKKRIFVTLAGYVCFCAASVAGQGGDFNDIEMVPEELEGAIFVPDDHMEEFEMSVVEPLDEEMDLDDERGLRYGYGRGRKRYRYCRHHRRYRNGYYYRKLEIDGDEADNLEQEDFDWPEQDRELGSMEYSRKKSPDPERTGRYRHRGYDCRRRRRRRRRRRYKNRRYRGGRGYGY